ncbi:MAG: YggS family pyridoxal phosphate-dependent enzyme [Dissulfurispiraceae bacterium]
MLLTNAAELFKRMSHAAMRAGRNPEEVRLVAVTKTVAVEDIVEAMDAGLRIFGESRVQEAQKKLMDDRLSEMREGREWHFIGHLQKNKAKYVVSMFDLIHTVDSVSLAEDLNREAEKVGKNQRVLVQLKLSEEVSKSGVFEQELESLLERIHGLANLKLEGLMGMPPYFEDPNNARQYFGRLRRRRDMAEMEGFHLPELSMGMSHDFEVAIEEGATLVRIGSALFGERSKRL